MTVLALPPDLSPDAVVALEAIARRREHQEQNFGADRDDTYTRRELARAASAYAWFASLAHGGRQDIQTNFWAKLWPKSWTKGWSPKTPREDLIDAGALIVAEIERLDRAERRAAGHPG